MVIVLIFTNNYDYKTGVYNFAIMLNICFAFEIPIDRQLEDTNPNLTYWRSDLGHIYMKTEKKRNDKDLHDWEPL